MNREQIIQEIKLLQKQLIPIKCVSCSIEGRRLMNRIDFLRYQLSKLDK